MKWIEPTTRYSDYVEYIDDFRQIALEIHDNPSRILHHVEMSAVPFLLNDRHSNTLERTQYLEALSYGDPGVLLACPGPSLSGITLRELGLPEQIHYFYDFIQKNKSRTCFALTEPKKGSDASNITTQIIKQGNQYYLQGEKCFFGNGAVADIGVVFAKIADNPIGLRAVLLTQDILNSHTVKRETLPQFSLRGAQIAVMKFDHTPIPHEHILGMQRRACEIGSLAIVKIFNQFRTGVGALALGQAQSVFDACYQNYATHFSKNELEFMDAQLQTTRALLHKAATLIDNDPYNGVLVSAAKLQATQTAETIISRCVEKLPFEILLGDPWILKASRDVYAWEFMEGTTHIQLKNIGRQLDSVFVKND